MCCCRWCCVTPSPFPDEVLGSTRLILLKIIITLLSLGVAASCAYGMSKVDPKLVDSGLGVINSIKVGRPLHVLAKWHWHPCSTFARESVTRAVLTSYVRSERSQ